MSLPTLPPGYHMTTTFTWLSDENHVPVQSWSFTHHGRQHLVEYPSLNRAYSEIITKANQ